MTALLALSGGAHLGTITRDGQVHGPYKVKSPALLERERESLGSCSVTLLTMPKTGIIALVMRPESQNKQLRSVEFKKHKIICRQTQTIIIIKGRFKPRKTAKRPYIWQINPAGRWYRTKLPPRNRTKEHSQPHRNRSAVDLC